MVSDAQLQADVLYGDKKGKWRTDMGAKLPLNKDDFVYLGVSDIGDRDRLDFHYNKRLNKFMLGRAGVIEGDFGVGMDWNLSPKFKLFTDFYDFDDAKLKVGRMGLQPQFIPLGRVWMCWTTVLRPLMWAFGHISKQILN